MTEKSHKRRLRSDHTGSLSNVEVASLSNDENFKLSERDFEDIWNKIENKISKHLRDPNLAEEKS